MFFALNFNMLVCFIVLSEEYKMIKVQNIGKDTLQATCRKACAKIDMGLMPLSNIDDDWWCLKQLPEYNHEEQQKIMTDGREIFSGGTSTFLSTPTGGTVTMVHQGFLTDPDRGQNRPGVYCVKLFWGVYMSADCKVNRARDWCGCKRGKSIARNRWTSYALELEKNGAKNVYSGVVKSVLFRSQPIFSLEKS